MDVIKCDRCGAVGEYFHKVRFFDGSWNGEQTYDLCNKCSKEFRKWFNKWV